MSQDQHRPCRRPGWPCRALYRRAPRWRCCAYRSFLRRIVALSLAVSLPYRDTTQRPSRMPVTIHPFVSRHSPPAAKPSRPCRSPLRAGRPCRLVALLWPYPQPGRVVALRLRPGQPSQPLCHDTNCCIVTQCMLKMGSSPTTACNVSLFFVSHLFFFSSFQLLENHLKKYYHYYYYYFQFPVNQINLLKFILSFFFQFYTL